MPQTWIYVDWADSCFGDCFYPDYYRTKAIAWIPPNSNVGAEKNCYSAGLPCIPDAGKIRVNSNRIRHYFSKSESGWSDLNSLTLRADRNRDGDLEDTREKIAYRYDQQTLTLFRKSGNSAYQTLIESIPALKFEILEGSSPQTCIKVTVQVIIDAPEQETVLCQLVW